MNNVALGQYMPLDSVVHKMDPRSKIMIMLFLIRPMNATLLPNWISIQMWSYM